MNETLGAFEVLVLTAVIASGEDSYEMVIHEEVECLLPASRNVSIGAVYTTLGQLEEKGYVRSWSGPAGSERGGRPRRYFELTGIGQRTFREALKPMKRAIELVGDDV